MPAVVFVSAKGSPGVTTSVAALAAAAAAVPGSLLVELDPGGGDLAVLTRSPAKRGLVEAAGRLRRERSADAVKQNTTQLEGGLNVVMAPTSGGTAESVIRSVGSRWMPTLALGAPAVMVDGGRWRASQATAERISGADLVVLVCRSTLESVEHARHLVPGLREQARRQVAVLVVGGKPYTPEEVADHLAVPLVGGIAWDSRGVAALWAAGPKKTWFRTRLGRSAAGALRGLIEMAGPDNRRALAAPTSPAPGTAGPGLPAAVSPEPTSPAPPSRSLWDDAPASEPTPAPAPPPTRSPWPDAPAAAPTRSPWTDAPASPAPSAPPPISPPRSPAPSAPPTSPPPASPAPSAPPPGPPPPPPSPSPRAPARRPDPQPEAPVRRWPGLPSSEAPSQSAPQPTEPAPNGSQEPPPGPPGSPLGTGASSPPDGSASPPLTPAEATTLVPSPPTHPDRPAVEPSRDGVSTPPEGTPRFEAAAPAAPRDNGGTPR